MSKLKPSTAIPVIFQTSVEVDGRPLIAECQPNDLLLREKGRKRGYLISWESALWFGVRMAAGLQRDQRERKKAS